MPKWVYPLAFLFVLFLIYTEPGGAGEVASNFAEFLVNMLGSIGEFLTGLFEGASGEPRTLDGSSSFGTGRGTTTTIVDSFNRLHDATPHTHGG